MIECQECGHRTPLQLCTRVRTQVAHVTYLPMPMDAVTWKHGMPHMHAHMPCMLTQVTWMPCRMLTQVTWMLRHEPREPRKTILATGTGILEQGEVR